MSKQPLFAIPSFPGSNGEVDNMRTLRRCGFDAFVFRWNDSREKLKDVDGYFFGAGFSYEDRGRSGMVAARDPLFSFMREEAAKGKVIIGNCNGAQVLVESGLIPLGDGLRMCLAHNAIRDGQSWVSPGFLNQWVWIKPSCARDRCAVSDWSGTLHIPIAHGEGRFVTKDKDLIDQLKKEDQIAFQYCNAEGVVSVDAPVTPNGSMLAIAGICNPAGNVVALMPHPERTENGDPYFVSVRRWIEKKWKVESGLPTEALAKAGKWKIQQSSSQHDSLSIFNFQFSIRQRSPLPVEIFIDTIITNNEERTVEQAARRVDPAVTVKQFRYVGLQTDRSAQLLTTFSFFNPNKEIAFVRKAGSLYRWRSDEKRLEPTTQAVLGSLAVLRRNEPDTGAASIGDGSETGVCYDVQNITAEKLRRTELAEIFGNPNASTLEMFS